MERKKENRLEDKAQRKDARKEKREARKTARKSKPKKELDISIDGKKVDIDIDRESNGDLEVNIDAQKFDAKDTRKGDKVSIEVDLDDDQTYLFESNGTNRRLPKGALWKLTGAVIKTFLKRGWGKLKK